MSRAAALRRAAIRATLATSIMNTQPWRIEVHADRLELLADRDRALPVIDPLGRQLTLSLGCALFNARVAVAAADVGVEVRRLPDPGRGDLVAQLRLSEVAEDDGIGDLDQHIEGARPTQAGLRNVVIDVEVLARARAAAAAEGCRLHICDEHERVTVALRAWQAEQTVEASPAAVAEMKAWLSSDDSRLDGVKRVATMLSVAEEAAIDEAGVREAARTECIAVLVSPGDDAAAWIRAGEALQRVLLELASAGLGFGLLSTPIELAETRREITDTLGLDGGAQLVIRIGAGGDAPPLRRRRLVDVLADHSDDVRPG